MGIAFNIQNYLTHETIYFRPFTFQSREKIKREHSIQHLSVPKYDWRISRTNNEGEFEAEYPRQPSPDDWLSVKIKVEEDSLSVFEKESDKALLSIKKLATPISEQIGLWMGHNSEGKFRNLGINKKDHMINHINSYVIITQKY